mmetsp:Transcript_3767/g.5570  ORF Transcript_3767/g.5570 Transcript_3767/m.5570 type:complete len:550 (+) Transcript_3767:3283-4932(+)
MNKQQLPDAKELKRRIQKMAPVQIGTPFDDLTDGDKTCVFELIKAAKIMRELYQSQVAPYNLLIDKHVDDEAKKHPNDDYARLVRQFYKMNLMPWDEQEEIQQFVKSFDNITIPPHPPKNANYYPSDMSVDEFNDFVSVLTKEEQEAAKGFYTTIQRGNLGDLVVEPYSKTYSSWIKQMIPYFESAAKWTTDASLQHFLKTFITALQNDSYEASDRAWMKLDGALDITCGPYETYMDDLMGLKAAYEIAITKVNPEETKKLERFENLMQYMEDSLPMPNEYKRKLGGASSIRVVDMIYADAEFASGTQTAAFNLPNNEKIIKDMGSKRIMLRNVQQAKFGKVLKPIADRLIDTKQLNMVSFDAFFTHILLHEISHGIGPQTVHQSTKSVREALQELYSPIEEAKADIIGLYLTTLEKLEFTNVNDFFVTFLASTFRSIRFGITEAHAKGNAMIFNYILKEGGYTFNRDTKKFAIDPEKIFKATTTLTTKILVLQAKGDKQAGKELLDTYGKMTPELSIALDLLKDVPVDIRPIYFNDPEYDGTKQTFGL